MIYRSVFKMSVLLPVLIVGLCLGRQSYTFSQTPETSEASFSVFSFGIHYGASLPMGELGDRFGYMNNIGVKTEYLSRKNWYYRLSGNYHFGSQVNEDVLSNLRISTGNIIGNDKRFADIFMRGRLWHVSFGFGKLIPFKKRGKTGLLINAGVGFISHKVRVQDDSQSVPQVLDFNLPGYDRLTAGLVTQQQIGFYSNEAARGVGVKYYALLELNQGFTEGLRTLNYSTNTSQKGERRFDVLTCFKVGILLPIGVYEPGKEYFY